MTNPITDPLVENLISAEVAQAPVRLDASPDGVAVVTVEKPQRGRELDGPTLAALTELFETLHGAQGVRVVFIRGPGLTFDAGEDADWLRTAPDWSEDDNRDDAMSLARMLKTLSGVPALTVALLDGVIHAGGLGLAAACDMAIATAEAEFRVSEVKLGLSPAVIAPYVVNAIGPRAAKGLFVSARGFNAAHAYAIGLVQEVVTGAAALEAARAALAAEVKACAPEAAADAKRLVWEVWARPIDHHLMEETARRAARARMSEEGREGLAALLAGRKPRWAE